MQNEQNLRHQPHRTKRSPAHTKQRTLNHSRSRINQSKHKHRSTEQDDPNDNIRMINQSMVELQDPQFIADEIDQFQSKLVVQKAQKGFCQVSREQSLLLSNTQGYRKYRKEAKLNHIVQASKPPQEQNHTKTVQTQTKKQEAPTKNQADEQQSSLCYSSQSRSRKLRQKQSIGIQNISNVSIDIQKNEPPLDDKNSLLQKHQSF